MLLLSVRSRLRALLLHDSARFALGRIGRDHAGLVGGGANPLLFGNRMGITLAVDDMLACDARCADERLAGTRLRERHDERAFLAYEFSPMRIITPMIRRRIAPGVFVLCCRGLSHKMVLLPRDHRLTP
jgi:hypothetical protein